MRKNYIFFGIILLASLLRVIGTNPGYNKYHADEPILYGTAIDMVTRGNIDPNRFDYPAGTIFINFVFFKFLFIPLSYLKYFAVNILNLVDGLVQLPKSSIEWERILRLEIIGTKVFYPLFWGRYIVSLFSIGSVVLIYIFSRKVFNNFIGLLSAFLLTVNFRQVMAAHMNLPDPYNAFFLILSLYFTYRMWKKPTTVNYLYAGLCAGASFSMKYQIFSFLPIIFAHLDLLIVNKNIKLGQLISRKVFILGFSVLIVFVLLNPYFFIHFESAKMWTSAVSARYAMGVNKLNFFPFSYLYHYDYGPIEFVLVVLGMIVSIIKYPKRFLFLLTIILPFFFVFTYFSAGGFYVRNFVTITPFLLIFASIFIYHFYELLRIRFNDFFSKIVLVFLIGLTVFVPFRNSLLNTYYYTKEWGYYVLSDWLNKNLDPNSVVAANPFDPPTGAPVMIKTEFELSGSYSMSEHRDDGAKYSILNSDWAANLFFFWMSYGYKDLAKYWNKPMYILRNTFYGLSIEELMRYQVFSTFKPWQAPDEALVFSKFPDWGKVDFGIKEKFEFSEGLSGWTVVDKENYDSDFVWDSASGNKNKGSILFLSSGSPYSIVRIRSNLISVKPGYLYKVDGFIRSDNEFSAKQRNGFLRIDYWSDDDLTKMPIYSAISSRLFGTIKWNLKSVYERAPENSKYLTISFQMADNLTSKMWLDDVILSESKKDVDDITSSSPYNKQKIDLDLFYTNSHGNL